jgi:methyl-accepting chemotaxis protein
MQRFGKNMALFKNLSIQSKIMSVLSLFVLLCGFLAWFGSSRLSMAAVETSGLVNNQSESLRAAALAMEHSTKINALWYEFVIEPAEKRKNLLDEIAEERKKRAENLADFQRFVDGPDVARLATIQSALQDNVTATAKVQALITAGRRDEADVVMERDVAGAYDRADQAFNDIVTQQKADLAAGAVQAQSDADSALRMLMIATVAGLLVIGGAAVAIVRSQIAGPLKALITTIAKLTDGHNDVEVAGTERRDEIGTMARALLVFRDAAIAKVAAETDKAAADATSQMVVEELGANLSSLSERDLTTRVTADFPGGFARLKSNFNDALENIQVAIRQVGESAANIRTGSAEIAQASEDLARRTESNAASLEETSAALAQIDGRLKATAASSAQTVHRADQAMATVDGGRATAEEAVAAMGRVSDSAKGIDSVIEGLDKIAFQTRVLAMNAAVEAGRAGDAGRGFAVVADLVSALAMRAEEEAKRARDQLTVTQTDIVTAVQAVQKVDGALANISSDVDEVNKLLGTMASDATAQSAAITQISAAIGAMDQSTQQNAAMVEETSAAARNLTAEVGALTEQAGLFRIGNEAPTRRAPAPPPAPASDASKATRGKPAPYRSPVKALAAANTPADASQDWNAF